MKIVVCVKQVPGSSQVRMDPVTRTLVREARHAVINPCDAVAAALALQLARDGTITLALSMGIPATDHLLQDLLSRGIDKAILLSDPIFAGSDTLATARTLAAAVNKLGGADLILCGRMAIDGDTAQTGPELAEQLGMPHLTNISGARWIDAHTLEVRRRTDRAAETLHVTLPALLTIARDACQPSMPSISQVLASRDRWPVRWTAADLSLQPDRTGKSGSPTWVVKTFVPERMKTARDLPGTPDQQARAILDTLSEVRP